jgi:hypothetical protein
VCLALTNQNQTRNGNGNGNGNPNQPEPNPNPNPTQPQYVPFFTVMTPIAFVLSPSLLNGMLGLVLWLHLMIAIPYDRTLFLHVCSPVPCPSLLLLYKYLLILLLAHSSLHMHTLVCMLLLRTTFQPTCRVLYWYAYYCFKLCVWLKLSSISQVHLLTNIPFLSAVCLVIHHLCLQLALKAVTLLLLIGLLKLNLCGCGLTESIKSLWRAPVKQE